jgi:hypothetical protein
MGLTGCSGSRPLAVRAIARPSVCSERTSSMRCPGSGPPARSFGSRPSPSRRWCRGPSAGEPEPVAGGEPAVAFGDLLAASQWIAETSSVLGVDPEGSEFPITPHSLPIEFPPVPRGGRVARKTPSVEGEKTWSRQELSGNCRGDYGQCTWGRVEQAGRRISARD